MPVLLVLCLSSCLFNHNEGLKQLHLFQTGMSIRLIPWVKDKTLEDLSLSLPMVLS